MVRPDLIVFYIDNPRGENSGRYRVGYDLDLNGNVASWSDVKSVNGWHGSENQGAGVVLAGDINNNGRPDLVTFFIDNPGQRKWWLLSRRLRY